MGVNAMPRRRMEQRPIEDGDRRFVERQSPYDAEKWHVYDTKSDRYLGGGSQRVIRALAAHLNAAEAMVSPAPVLPPNTPEDVR